MRRLVLASPLFLAACVARQPQPAAPVVAAPAARGELIGLSPSELVSHFGSPALQIREGSSLKLQFRSRHCVLDAFLYPSTGDEMRVTYVDTRLRSGAETDQAACISALENPS